MKVIQLKGTARENGTLIGKTFKTNIHALAEIRNYLLKAFLRKTPEEQIVKLAEDQIRTLEKSVPELYDEFEAIAQSAEISLTDLAILNNYTDMRDFYADKSAEAVSTGKDGDGGCSVFSYMTERGQICGQTWDMHVSARPHILHMTIESPARPLCHVFSVTGCLGLSGVNEYGVCVFINNLHCSETSTGLMWPALVRGLLWQKTAKEAVEFLQSHMPASGHNYTICDANESFNIETTGKRIEITSHYSKENTGIAIHANHYLGQLKNIEITNRLSATTHDRQNKLESYFKHAEFSFDQIIEDIFERKKLSGIDYDPPINKPHASATCGGILVDLINRRGLTYQSTYLENDHFIFDL